MEKALDIIVNVDYNIHMEPEGLVDTIYQAHRLLSEWEATPRDYGTKRTFFASEIHTLECIADNPGINLTQIAERLGVSKSAVSKVVRKLAASGHARKGPQPHNRKEVSFDATAMGRRAVQGHRRFRSASFQPLFDIEAGLSRKEFDVIRLFLMRLHAALKSE